MNNYQINLPEEFKKIDGPLPPNMGLPKEAAAFNAGNENFSAFILCFPVSPEASMPFNDTERIIDDLHSSMNDSQGIIEVMAGTCKNGGKYVYYLLKYKKPSLRRLPRGNGYLLYFNLQIGNTIQFINATFEEEGITGMRDSAVYSLFRQNKKQEGKDMSDNPFDGWFKDPYCEDYTKGFLMDLSEQSEFDEQFPQHPLSAARRFVAYVISNN